LFLTIFNCFRQILVVFKYFVQLDWLIIVQNLKIEQHESHLKPDGTLSVTTWVFSFALHGSSRFCTMISQLHCLPFFDIWLPITLLASTNFSYLLTYARTTILSQLSNLFHCNIYVKIYWRLQLKTRTELCRWQLESLVLHCMAVPGFLRWSASLIVQDIWMLPKYVENNLK
jgi:hypothetical protein